METTTTNQSIAIWGAGKLGQLFYQRHKQNYNTLYFIDDDSTKIGRSIEGIPIKKWDGDCDCKIIIAVDSCEDIVLSLVEKGLHWPKDFEFAKFLDNPMSYDDLAKIPVKDRQYLKEYTLDYQVACVYGNCQTTMISKMMRLKLWDKRILLVDIPTVCEYIDTPKRVTDFINDKDFWNIIDVFIYQQVSENNRFSKIVSSNNILTKLRDDCMKISIINMYFNGYFPQYAVRSEKNKKLQEIHQSGVFPFEDTIVGELKKKYSEVDVLKIVSDKKLFHEKVVLALCEDSIKRLKNRERNVNIKITDWIENNYREQQLFYSVNHPINDLIEEYCNRIILYMGFNDFVKKLGNEREVYCGTLKGQDIPIYPSVVEALKLKKYDDFYFSNRYLDGGLLFDFAEYEKMMYEN